MKLLLIVLWLITIPLPDDFYKSLSETQAKEKACAWWGENAAAGLDQETNTYWVGMRTKFGNTIWYGHSKKNWEDAFTDAVKYGYIDGYHEDKNLLPSQGNLK